jgi:type I restriction enzyme M protein
MGTSATSGSNSAFDGLEAQLWAAADALRNNMDAAEYSLLVLAEPVNRSVTL